MHPPQKLHGLPSGHDLTIPVIFKFWLPLALTWILMSGSQPTMAMIVARLPEPVENLAAFGVGYSVAIFMEFPIIMLLSAATRLVNDRASYERLRAFALALNIGVGLLALTISVTPAMEWLARNVIGVSDNLIDRVRLVALVLVPWPVCIGYRRFIQGVLIREGRTDLVGVGTLVRVITVVIAGLFFGMVMQLPGAIAGAVTLSIAVIAECAVTLWMGRHVIRRLKERSVGPPPAYGAIMSFYYPLVLTSLLSIATTPLINMFMGQSRMGLESLAAFPVTMGVIQIFRGIAQSYQEVVIALRGDGGEGDAALGRFAKIMGWTMFAALAVIAFTPALARGLFENLGGLRPELTDLAIPAFQIGVTYAAGSVLYHWQRAILVHRHRTMPITVASGVEIIGTAVTLYVCIHVMQMIGIHAAAWALLLGRTASVLYLVPAMKPRVRAVV